MAETYFVQTAAEAARVADQLRARGFDVTECRDPRGHRLTVARAPSVDVEEALIRYAPSAQKM